jgi:hypothetical protein
MLTTRACWPVVTSPVIQATAPVRRVGSVTITGPVDGVPGTVPTVGNGVPSVSRTMVQIGPDALKSP